MSQDQDQPTPGTKLVWTSGYNLLMMMGLLPGSGKNHVGRWPVVADAIEKGYKAYFQN